MWRPRGDEHLPDLVDFTFEEACSQRCLGRPCPLERASSRRALRHSAPINGAPGARCSRAAQLLLLLAHVCALALTLSVLSHSYARLTFRRLARWLIARSKVVERSFTYYLYYDEIETVNPLGQFQRELDERLRKRFSQRCAHT